jgi:hypothetical protein
MTTKSKLRIVNVLFWLSVWGLVVYKTGTFGEWVIMAFQSVISLMIGVMIHIALRPTASASTPEPRFEPAPPKQL